MTKVIVDAKEPWCKERRRLFPRRFTNRIARVLMLQQRLHWQAVEFVRRHGEQPYDPRRRRRRMTRQQARRLRALYNGRLTPDIWLKVVPFVLESRKLAVAAATEVVVSRP